MVQIKSQNKSQLMLSTEATKMVTSSIGIIGAGFAGMVHGFFAILQGNITTGGIVINPIGPAQRLWPQAALHAISIIPNYIISGICAMIIGLLIIIWAWVFIDKLFGARVLLILSVILLLVGGGFGSAFLGIIASLTATQINKPLSWWRHHLDKNLRNILNKLWPCALIVYQIFFISSIGIAIFGIPLLWLFNADTTYSILLNLGPISDIFLLVAILSAFSSDIQKQAEITPASSMEKKLG
ncbi:MAG: hypothetical protein JW704_09640 [Anaerolineaceae bacterium]|nr:hypothetical protein [Anaerolineaceae bacterium]